AAERAADAKAPNVKLAPVLQPFVDEHTLAGAVLLVADKDRGLTLESVGFADVAAGKLIGLDLLFWIAPWPRPITAAALRMLVDEGKVDLDDPVENYLPEFRGMSVSVYQDKDTTLLRKANQPMTVRQLLTHTSGLPFRSAPEQPTLDR